MSDDCEEIVMVCTCGLDAKIMAEQARIYACEALGVMPAQLATAICLSFAFEHGAELTTYSDQWFGIDLDFADGRTDSVQCDDPLDGIVYLWTKHESAKPRPHNRLHVHAIPSPSSWWMWFGHQALAQSDLDLKAFAAARVAEDGHEVTCFDCSDGKEGRPSRLCPVAKSLLDAWAVAYHKMVDKWSTGTWETWPTFYDARR